MALPYKQASDLPSRFKPMAKANYPSPVKYALALTADEKTAAFQKFMADGNARADAMFATGACSKQQVIDLVTDLCPFK